MCISPHTKQMCMLWPWQRCCCGITVMTHIICPPFRTQLLSSKAQQQPNKFPWCGINVCHCQCHESDLRSSHRLVLHLNVMSLKAVTRSTIVSQPVCMIIPRQQKCHHAVLKQRWLAIIDDSPIIGVIRDATTTSHLMFWLVLVVGFFGELLFKVLISNTTYHQNKCL